MTLYSLHGISGGPTGTRQTLQLMSSLARRYKKAPLIRELAIKLTRDLPSKKWRAEVTAIRNFVRDRIRYTKDIYGVETVQTPVQTLRLRAGDCDDHSLLVASLLAALGHPTRFIAIGFLPNHFNHVLTETKIGGRWVTVETTEPVNIGWFPRGVKSQMRAYNK